MPNVITNLKDVDYHEVAIKMSASNLKLDPYKYGASMAKSGYDFYLPYTCDENNKLYRQGYYSVQKDEVA